MNLSEKGRKFIENEEGCVLHVYKDQAGLPTIGIGHLLTRSEISSGKIIIAGQPVKYRDGITEEQALSLLGQDVIPAESAVVAFVKVRLNQGQFDALVSFTFNCGNGALHGSTLLKVLNQGDYAAVPDQLRRWHHAGGVDCEDLKKRREREIKLWEGNWQC